MAAIGQPETAGLGLGVGALVLLGGQEAGQVLEGLAGRLDPVEDVNLLLGLDQLAEEQRAGDPADAGANGVEELCPPCSGTPRAAERTPAPVAWEG
jgi:hypothetical protein